MRKEFFEGFEKRAFSARIGPAITLGIYGALAGLVIAGFKNRTALEELRTASGKEDAHKIFNKYKKDFKDVGIFTTSDLNKLIQKAKTGEHVQTLQGARDPLEQGNAMALHKTMVPNQESSFLPPELKNKNAIFVNDTVHPSILGHELGHIKDFEEHSKKSFGGRILGSFRDAETAAWDKSPITPDRDIKEKALSTYRRAKYYPLVGGALGALLGMGLKNLK